MLDHQGSQLIQIAPLDPQAPPIPQAKLAQKPHDHHAKFLVGLDVGSTTVKAVVVESSSDQVLWQDYQRHETRQPEKTLDFLKRMEAEAGINAHNTRIFMTGSGGGAIGDQIGAKFVQEVNAVALAVDAVHKGAQVHSNEGAQDLQAGRGGRRVVRPGRIGGPRDRH